MTCDPAHREVSLSPERSGGERGPFTPQIIAIFALLSALYPGNMGVDHIRLRLIVSASCAVLAFRASKRGSAGWTRTLAATALIYFPLFPVHLSPEMWSYLYMATVVLLAATIRFFGKREYPEHSEFHQPGGE